MYVECQSNFDEFGDVLLAFTFGDRLLFAAALIEAAHFGRGCRVAHLVNPGR